MKVTHLELWNFRGIEHLAVDFTERTTALVGVNGVGKSTVLDALAIALSQLTSRLPLPTGAPRSIELDDVRLGAESARIQITVGRKDRSVTWAISRPGGSNPDPLASGQDLDELEAFSALLRDEYMHQQPGSLPLAVYYDVHRAVLDVPLRVREKLEHSPAEVYQDALDHGGADFKRFFIWFRDFEDVENEARIDDPDFRERGLEATRQAVQTFAGFSNLRIRRKPTMKMTVTKGDKELNVLQLSDGERNMLALVGDIARRLSVLNSIDLDRLNEGAGVVLIDEVDLHLHPRWQREIVAKLVATFPNCQFIVSTHSSQVLGELKPESVVLLRDGRLLGHPQASYGLTSGQVLEEIMDASSRTSEVKAQLDSIFENLERGALPEARQMIAALKQNAPSVPELAGAEALLKRKEVLGR